MRRCKLQILDALEQRGPLTMADLSYRTGFSERHIRKALPDLLETSRVIRSTAKRPHVYSLPTTESGFRIYGQLIDSHGTAIRVQESSAASGSHVWIFSTPNPETPDAQPHLTPKQAERLVSMLQDFIAEARRCQ